MTTDDFAATVEARDALHELAGIALAEHSLPSVLQTVADLTKRVMPGETEASLTVLAPRRPATVVFTGQLALDLDESQYGQGYGPCLHAARSGETVEITDARTDPRWPEYLAAAVERGALSSLSIPLGSPEKMGAALNVYARAAAAFDDVSRDTARRFARFAGVAVANMHAYESARELSDNLQLALENRAVIDQAKGILIERHRMTAQQAFEMLAQASMGTNRKLRDVAELLVRTGELMPPPRRK